MSAYIDDVAGVSDDSGSGSDGDAFTGEFDDFLCDEPEVSGSEERTDEFETPARKRTRLDPRLRVPEDSDVSGTPPASQDPDVQTAPAVDEIAAGEDAGVLDKAGAFRLRHTKSFLTYSKAGSLSKDSLVKFLLTLPIKRFGVFEEKHADGDPHFHVVIDWSRQTNYKNARCLDCCGVHPNIRKAHSNSWKYCVQPVKDKEVDHSPYLHGITVGEILAGDKWQHLMSIETEGEFVKQCLKVAGRDYVLNRDRLLNNWRAHRRGLKAVTERLIPFGPYPEKFYLGADDGATMVGAGEVDGLPKAWMKDTHAALLHGPPGVGKTSFAIYYMRHICGCEPFVVTGTLNSLKFNHWNGSDPLIFDDMFFAGDKDDPQLSNTLTTVFEPRTLRVLYGTIDIPAGVPRIFLSNYAHPFKNAGGSVYGRRVQSFSIER